MAGELKRTLDEVTGEREKLETIFAYLNDGVVAFDPSGAPIQINQTAVKLLDLSETKKGIPLGEFISLLSLPTSSEVIFSPDFRSIAFREISYKGKMIDISIGKFNIELDNKPYGGIIAVLHDVSEHFELEKSRREFVATVSHELRTPLTGIKGATESVIEDPDMPPEIRAHFLEMVVNESDRMTRIVRDLLMISRLDNNRLSWDPSYFDPAALMRDCVEMLGTEAGQHRHSLVASCSDESVPMLYADRERTAQVMINVIQNAIKYTPDGGNIAISVFYRYCDNIEGLPKANYVVYIVKDNGIGIPKEDIPHIFDRFYRVEKARSSQTGGTGLGLSIANEIVCAHGGKIVIESELDKGTTVYIFIPEAHTVNSAGKNGANTEINGTRKP
ncbi:Sensor histidine kinase WalK [bioreactor metagenome]|uniref:histidine kinase n=1 Tax=bioreactor metagenome TaxID=1076179 RepID=A0A645BX60_9ZZZZ